MMGPRLLLLALLALVAAAPARPQAAFTEKVSTAGRVNLAVSNYGRLGNDFRNRGSSFEFPDGDEHMTRAGIWVGGIFITGDTLVTTSIVDIYEGSASGAETEFTPRVDPSWPPGVFLLERSSQPSSQYASPDAIADQEFIGLYDDADSTGSGDDRHRPMRVKFRQTALAWGFEPFDRIVFLNYELTNLNPSQDIFDVAVGFYAELATGNKDASSRWPPGSAWYGKKDIAYVDSLHMVWEKRHEGIPGDALFTSSVCAIKFLGISPALTDSLEEDPPGTLGGRTFSSNWWHWDPGSVERDSDRERYEIMLNGSIRPTNGSEFPQFDPVNLLSVGPFQTLGPAEADTIRFSIAMLVGEDYAQLEEAALVAQDAYEKEFRIPVPPVVPNFFVEPGQQSLTVHWDDSPEFAIDPQSGIVDFEGYRIYLSEVGTGSSFELIKEADIVDEPTGAAQEDIRFNTGFDALIAPDPLMVDGIVYKYRYTIRNLRDGFKYWVALTAFDRGADEIGPLESGISLTETMTIPGTPAVAETRGPGTTVGVFPNPYRGAAQWDDEFLRDRYLWFTNLPGRCIIRIYTVAGDLVDEIDFDGETYDARDIRGIYDPTDPQNPESDLPVLPGGMAAWDLITESDQAVATGLYIFSVEDLETGQTQVGRFMVIK